MNEERRDNIKGAKAKYKEAWWDSDDPVILFLGQIQEEVLLVDFGKFHKAAQKALGRKIAAHEFGEHEELLDEFYKERPKATMVDVLDKLERYGIPMLMITNK